MQIVFPVVSDLPYVVLHAGVVRSLTRKMTLVGVLSSTFKRNPMRPRFDFRDSVFILLLRSSVFLADDDKNYFLFQ